MSHIRIDVMLSQLRTLWQQVTSDLRSVTVRRVGSAKTGAIAARFLHGGRVP